jgi:hypothetical protein
VCRSAECPHRGATRLEDTEKWQRFLLLDRDQDATLASLAKELNVTSRTISRWRVRAERNRKSGSGRPLSPEVVARIEQLMADECPMSEIRRTTGISEQTLYKRWPDYRIGLTPGLQALMRRSSEIIGYPSDGVQRRPDALAG